MKTLGRPLASLLAVCALAGGSAAAASASTAPGTHTAASVRTAASTPAGPADAASARLVAGPDRTPIKHVVEIMLENHTFDDLFGSFPGADGIPAGQTLPNPNAQWSPAPPVQPMWAAANEGNVGSVLDNSRPVEQMAMDYEPGAGYTMDHYTMYPSDGLASITEFGPQFDPNLQYMARHYALADHNFQPMIGPSNPNILYALNGTDQGWVYNSLKPNATWYSIFKEMDAAGLTSKLYYGLPAGTLGPFWDNLFPQDRVAQDATTDTAFFADAASGSLPNFSLVRPDYSPYVEGDGGQDIEQGDAWLGEVVSAIAKSPDWSSTAIFITYDESGGFWDHVAPPVASGYGPRTPMVIVSPYTRPGVFHRQTTNVSILSFVQRLWHLPALTRMNQRQNDLLSAFDFRQAPLPAPRLPQVPANTVGFYPSTATPRPGQQFTVSLQVNTPALIPDSGASGPVTLTVIPPAGVAVPSGFPATVTLSAGAGSFTARFPAAGYYRVEATGPDGSQGWTTLDVGITPDTAP